MSAPAAFTLRDARLEDAATVRQLVRALAHYERKLSSFTALVQDFERALFGPRPYAQAILAEVAGEAVGVALYHTTFSTFTGKPGYFLEDLFVQREHRSAGIGRAFFTEMARRLKAEGGTSITWRVLKWNEPSITFYLRLGAKGDPGEWDNMSLSGDALARLTA